MNLLIVESPNKCAKIGAILEGIYGKGSWLVAASVGHIRDLPLRELGITRGERYIPHYEVNEDKKKVVASLGQKVKQVGKPNVYLATDPDREGEAIAFHLCEVLALDRRTTPRVYFHELTAGAIKTAIAGAVKLNIQLVSAQEARRVIDRLAGYEISPVATRKLGKNLSAGRVQSVALRLSVERERAITHFGSGPGAYKFVLKGQFLTPRSEPLEGVYHQSFETIAQARTCLEGLPGQPWQVFSLEEKPLSRNPPPPYTTASLQQDAMRKLSSATERWSAKSVMDAAQKLFEDGHITYVRTDSPNLSGEATSEIGKAITTRFGAVLFTPRRFKAKEAAQEAHEAIRPTHPETAQAGTTSSQRALYALIYARALASQMAPAQFMQTTLIIQGRSNQNRFVAKASVRTVAGYQLLYTEESEESEEATPSLLSAVSLGEPMKLATATATQNYEKPPRRYDEAGLVAELEKRGIGRPSTYAAILGRILLNEYVTVQNHTGIVRMAKRLLLDCARNTITAGEEKTTLGGEKQKLTPSPTGHELTLFLETYFGTLVDYQFTANMENQLDSVAEGKDTFQRVVAHFDTQHTRLLRAAELATPDLPSPHAPKLLGNYEGKPVEAFYSAKSKKTYLRLGEQIYLPLKDKKPEDCTLDDLTQVLAAKQVSAASVLHQVKDHRTTYTIREGQYGPYVSNGKESAPLKMARDKLTNLTASELADLIQAHQEYKKTAAKSGGKPKSKTGTAKSGGKSKK